MNSRRGFLTAAVGGSLGFAGGVAWSPLSGANGEVGAGSDLPSDADSGFCRDMTAHHVQAIVMCERVLGRETGDAVQAAATEVLRNQAIEVGTMRAWLADWGLPTTDPETVMGWMGMNDGEGMPRQMMPGLATDAELDELARESGIAQGRLWLQLMQAHHVGGVNMATAASELASQEKVRRLARIQAAVQSFEITQYDQLLTTTYA